MKKTNQFFKFLGITGEVYKGYTLIKVANRDWRIMMRGAPCWPYRFHRFKTRQDAREALCTND